MVQFLRGLRVLAILQLLDPRKNFPTYGNSLYALDTSKNFTPRMVAFLMVLSASSTFAAEWLEVNLSFLLRFQCSSLLHCSYQLWGSTACHVWRWVLLCSMHEVSFASGQVHVLFLTEHGVAKGASLAFQLSLRWDTAFCELCPSLVVAHRLCFDGWQFLAHSRKSCFTSLHSTSNLALATVIGKINAWLNNCVLFNFRGFSVICGLKLLF